MISIKFINMSNHVLLFFHIFFFHVFFLHCLSDFPIGGEVSIPIPSAYEEGFKGRAFFLESKEKEPNFRAALSVEADDGKYSCSLKVLLGDIVVWTSDHFLKFWPNRVCMMELNREGDLKVLDRTGRVGWSTGTSGQGVKRLQLEKKTGNLILINAKNNSKWQSFDYPTDILLWRQQLNDTTRLTSFSPNLAAFYTFAIARGMITLHLNFQDQNYSYWENKPLSNKNIAYARLGTKGLKLFDRNSKKIGQILSNSVEPVRYLSLGKTGNLEFYYYRNSTNHTKFWSSYKAIEHFCDLPLPCGPYKVCNSSTTNTCLELPTNQGSYNSVMEMVELEKVDTILKTTSPRTNLSKEECVGLCMDDCSCSAALYSAGVCSLYGIVGGAREIGRRTECSYWVKVPKDRDGNCGMCSSVMNKLLLFAEVVDVLAISLILGGFIYYLVKKYKKREFEALIIGL